MSYDPIRTYEVQGQMCPLLSAQASHTAGTNKSLITAITGKKIRVMGAKIQSAAAQGTYSFKSASAGTVLSPAFSAPASTLPPEDWPIQPQGGPGYIETNSGEGLFVDVGTNTVNFLIFYIAYKP